MLVKEYKTRIKMLKDAKGAPTGEITAVVSVFGNVDVVGDRVVKGAFASTLGDFKSSEDPIPMIWSHDWNNPMSHIGGWDASKAVETDEGLELTGKVDINNGNPVADQAYKLMDQRLVREFSFAYDVVSEKSASDGANELLELALIEAGPTLKGANDATRLVAAKALAKVGRTLSAKNESALREVVDTLSAASKSVQSVLSAVGDEPKSIVDADLSDETDEQKSDGEPTALENLADALKAAADIVTGMIADVKSDEEREPTDTPSGDADADAQKEQEEEDAKSFDETLAKLQTYSIEHSLGL